MPFMTVKKVLDFKPEGEGLKARAEVIDVSIGDAL